MVDLVNIDDIPNYRSRNTGVADVDTSNNTTFIDQEDIVCNKGIRTI